MKRVSLLYPRKFTVSELDTLRDLVQRGSVDAAHLVTQAHHRLATLDAQGFLDELKLRLRAAQESEAPIHPPFALPGR